MFKNKNRSNENMKIKQSRYLLTKEDDTFLIIRLIIVTEQLHNFIIKKVFFKISQYF